MPDGSLTVDGSAHGGPIQVFSLKPGSPRRPTIARGDGIYVWDTDGRRYTDVSSGPCAYNLGYANPRVTAAMRAQADKVLFAHPSQFETAENVALAELVTRHAGPGFERAWFVSGGSEAVESAVKFTRQYMVATGQPSRWKVISRHPAYHGNTLGALALTGDEAAHEMFAPLLRLMPKVPTPFTYRLPPNHTAESWARHCAAELERTIEREGSETVAAFIVEPVGGLATGALVSPDVYLETVRDICTRYGVLLIYDEVITGAGRTGAFLASHDTPRAKPDLVVLAKGLSGGYAPLGAVLAPAAMVSVVAASGGFMHGHTYLANPMACAVGVAAISEVVERDLAGNAARLESVWRRLLEDIADASAIIGDVRGRGLLFALELVADKKTRAMVPLDKLAAARFQALAMRQGLAVYCRRTNRGRDGEWVMASPPLIVTKDQLQEIAAGLRATVFALQDELTRAGVRLG